MASSSQKVSAKLNPTTSTTASTPSSRPTTPLPHTRPTNDHIVSFRHRLSQRRYPLDCPPLNVRWFYAVDVNFPGGLVPKYQSANSGQVPKRKPYDTLAPPTKAPSKYVAFTPRDSREIETAFQKLAEEEDAVEATAYKQHTEIDSVVGGDIGDMGGGSEKPEVKDVKVPVNEDYLFDVDIRKRELAPVYWLGPVYDVRRGTWFYQEGSTLRPCDENLATQLEEGYLKVKPFRTPPPADGKRPKTPVSPSEAGSSSTATPQPQQTWRLFGAHLNSFAVFADATTAWILTDNFYGKISTTLWQSITAGTNMGGVKLVRGYTEPNSIDKKEAVQSATPPPEEKEHKELDQKYKRMSAPPMSPMPLSPMDMADASPIAGRPSIDAGRIALERKMSSYAGDTEKMLESEMKDDYKADDETEDPGREIEHLLLVTHGIGQKLGMRMESVNFVHDVNVLRKSLKSVYAASPEIQVLNSGEMEKRKNCRIQCLPVCWRHLLDFPQQSLRQNRGETDLSTPDAPTYEESYPSLEDITVEGVPSVRNLMTDLALDVLLYQSATYREHIMTTVHAECERIVRLFRARNPSFNGRVSFVGHSLGSAILFDILCRSPPFPVHTFFALGSPIGLFQMMDGKTITSFPAPPNLNPYPTSSPQCSQIFNIFHPSDPIAYRLEPLISKAMAQLKPSPLPYTKRSLFANASGIGQSVSKSVAGFWTSLTTGVASTILNRSLGIDSTPAGQGGKDPVTAPVAEGVETLYSGFQRLGSVGGDEEGRRLEEEEEKVRRLNPSGRVDFAIQEGVFDISLIASIASHLSYWGDEDVGHFICKVVLERSDGGGRPKSRAAG